MSCVDILARATEAGWCITSTGAIVVERERRVTQLAWLMEWNQTAPHDCSDLMVNTTLH